jgi:glycosyltransferase involved in cell wall biosynthesis
MSAQRIIALLGRRDEPTDAVEDYCRLLGEALVLHDCDLHVRRVPWNAHGWDASLDALRLQAEAWNGTWVLVQYTALAWSARGFPYRFLKVLRILRKAGARIAVVFHDAEAFGGTRVIDRMRRIAQVRVMRAAIALSHWSVFTVEPARLSWPEHNSGNSCFIPVGANLPFPLAPQEHEHTHSPPCIGVYGITGGAAGDREVRDIIAAVQYASQKLGNLRLVVFGRHAEPREQALRDGLRECGVEVNVSGVIDDTQLVKRFAGLDVLLFVRGAISSRRGSAIAGISCGLPVIAQRGKETAPPITDAGVILVSGDLNQASLQLQFGEALVRVLSQKELRTQLVQRSRDAHEIHFSWRAIATRYAELLRMDAVDVSDASK